MSLDSMDSMVPQAIFAISVYEHEPIYRDAAELIERQAEQIRKLKRAAKRRKGKKK